MSEPPAPTGIPFADNLGAVVVSAAAQEVRLILDYAPHLCTTGDVLHGGLLMALADTAGAICALLNLPPGAAGTTTIESKTNFLKGVRSGQVQATSRPLHVGRRFIVVETDIVRADGVLAARTTQTQAVL